MRNDYVDFDLKNENKLSGIIANESVRQEYLCEEEYKK